MRNFQKTAGLAILLLISACSRHDDKPAAADAYSPPPLPRSWVQASPVLEAPSPEATAAVQTAFRVHTLALEEASLATREGSAGAHPPDWVPWHFDGMIGTFAVDVGGVFGALVGDGVSSVKVTWKKVDRQPAVPVMKLRSAYHFNAEMTAKDVTAMLEPAVQMAVEGRAVRDGATLRRNLNAQGMKFLSAVKVLSHVKPFPGWHIDGFQVSLLVGANGEVNPAIGVGGNVVLHFDWTVPPGPASPNTAANSPADKNMESFVQSVSSLIPQAAASATELRRAGFEFRRFEIGVGITAGGNVGIASAQAGAEGRIIFKSNEGPNEALLALAKTPQGHELNIILSPSESELLFASTSRPRPRVVSIAENRFRRGIQRAIKMGSFFARQAAAVDSPKWKTDEIELGFDVNITGDLTVATVEGTALVRMGFERVD